MMSQPSNTNQSEAGLSSTGKGFRFYEMLLEKMPKVPVDFAMITIWYLVITVAEVILIIALRLLSPKYISHIVWMFITVTGIYTATWLIYFFMYRLKRDA